MLLLIQNHLKLKKVAIGMMTIFLLSLLLFLIYQTNIKYSKPTITISKQDSITNVNENFLSVLHLGNKRLLASLLWIQTLLESDLDQYKGKDLNSWMYLRFKTIITLAPQFYEAYLLGGQYLSIIKDDDLGAKDIYEKGFIFFPDDFKLNFNMAYHYYFEIGDIDKAIFHFTKLQTNPLWKEMIPYLPSLLAKLVAQRGNIAMAFEIVKTAYDQTPSDSSMKKRLYDSLYAIKAEIDLGCLNGKEESIKDGCAKTDYEGASYLFSISEKKYYAKKKWIPFRPAKR